ncbi:MAG: hypothetical protein ACC645_00230 [Pirellulales bacterium]
MRRGDRGGFSLLEVLLATSILLGSAIVLGELVSLGSRSARLAQDEAAAERIARTRLDEISAGIVSVEADEESPVDGEPGWVVSVKQTPVESADLLSIEVTVKRESDEGRTARPFTLVRWIRNPQQDEQAEAPVDSDTAVRSETVFSGAGTP